MESSKINIQMYYWTGVDWTPLYTKSETCDRKLKVSHIFPRQESIAAICIAISSYFSFF